MKKINYNIGIDFIFLYIRIFIIFKFKCTIGVKVYVDICRTSNKKSIRYVRRIR